MAPSDDRTLRICHQHTLSTEILSKVLQVNRKENHIRNLGLQDGMKNVGIGK